MNVISETGTLPAPRMNERAARAAQLRVRPRGRGFVELSFEHGDGRPIVTEDGVTNATIVLQYPEETLLGADPRDVINARQLQKAATALNAMLLELSS